MVATRGALIATGSRSSVHAWGIDAVAKIPLAATPDAWIRYEADYSAAVSRAGAPVPEFLAFEHLDGRLVSIYRRARGPVMLEAMVDDPASAPLHARTLAELQSRLAMLVPPVAVPLQADRVRCKVRLAARRVDTSLDQAIAEIPPTLATRLCHGDMHPSNVILTTDGPMIVDWFDACRGDPAADVARTSLLLLRPTPGASRAPHLGRVSPELVDRIRVAYLAAAVDRFGISEAVLARWRAVMAVARVAEGVASDDLIEVWTRWRTARAGQPADSTA